MIPNLIILVHRLECTPKKWGGHLYGASPLIQRWGDMPPRPPGIAAPESWNDILGSVALPGSCVWGTVFDLVPLCWRGVNKHVGRTGELRPEGEARTEGAKCPRIEGKARD